LQLTAGSHRKATVRGLQLTSQQPDDGSKLQTANCKLGEANCKLTPI